MGYYTNFELEILEGDVTIQEVMENLKKEDPDHTLLIACDEDGDFMHECKWYDYSEDMKELSLKYPGVLFKMHGSGESIDDVWYEYFKDGKSQHCPVQLIFPEYDESLLK